MLFYTTKNSRKGKVLIIEMNRSIQKQDSPTKKIEADVLFK